MSQPLIYPVWCMIYNLYFHPLRKFPGPKIAAATQLYTSYHLCKGDGIPYINKLHEKYGEVVRTKPFELSFTTESAWKDIYMHRQGKPQMLKAHRENFEADQSVHNIITAPDDIHSRQRRAVAHAFSDKAVGQLFDVRTVLTRSTATRTRTHDPRVRESSGRRLARTSKNQDTHRYRTTPELGNIRHHWRLGIWRVFWRLAKKANSPMDQELFQDVIPRLLHFRVPRSSRRTVV